MSTLIAAVIPMGVLLPDSILRNEFIAVLAAFVAINTIVYVTLAVAKILPKVYVRDWIGTTQPRAETRSIDPRRPGLSRPRRTAPVALHRTCAEGSETQVTTLDRSNMCTDSQALASRESRRQRGRANQPRRTLKETGR